MDNEWVEVILKRYQNERAVFHVKSVQSDKGVTGADNYASVLARCNAEVILGSGKTEIKKLIVKNVPQTGTCRQFVTENFLFQLEIRVYENVLSPLETLMFKFNDKKEKLWCDLIGYRPYDRIVLQDLTELNYVVPNRTQTLDLDHCLLATRGLARFHALSKVAVNLKMVDPNMFGEYRLARDRKCVEMFSVGGVHCLSTVMKDSWGPEWSNEAERLRKLCDTLRQTLLDLNDENNETNNVINHGDIWQCNFLYKYDDYKNEPINIKFIDFQFVHYNSFVWDMIFLMYGVVDPELRRKNYSMICDVYHETLVETFKHYNFKGSFPTRKNIDEEMDRLKVFGFVMLCTVLPTTKSDIEDPFNLEVYGDDQNLRAGYNPKVFQSEAYKLAVEKDLRQFFEDGII